MSVLLLAAAAAAASPCSQEPRTLPALRLEKAADGFDHPVHVAHAGDGSGRLFVVEQAGRILIVGRQRPFLDISDRVRSGGEMGLLSVAFHPRFKANGRFYVNYTTSRGGLKSVVSELRASGDAADAASERVLLEVAQPYTNHNGGQLAFGPDGRLYAGFGDGGSGDDPHDHAQRDDTVLGKMIAIDVRTGRHEVFAKGLRNPWRFSFDRKTGRLWAGDVGQDHWEEIDVVERGKNYGWRVMEGRHCTPGVSPACDPAGYVLPVHEYPRKDGVSVTGGFVYRGAAEPALCGAYVFADFGSGTVWGLRLDARGRAARHAVLAETGYMISSFGEDEAGELHAADHAGGAVYRLRTR